MGVGAALQLVSQAKHHSRLNSWSSHLSLSNFPFQFSTFTSPTLNPTVVIVVIIIIIITVEPLLCGHPPGKGKWPLNRGWLLNKGSSGISQRLTINSTLLNYKHAWRLSTTAGARLLTTAVCNKVYYFFLAWCTCSRRNYILNNHRNLFQSSKCYN